MESKNLAELYDLDTLAWEGVLARLEQGVSQAPGTGGPDRHTCWLATINDDGSPHVTGVGALFVEGTFWFETGEPTRKARNLERDPRCSLSLSMLEYDLTIEGHARKVTDRATVASLAAQWRAGGWPAEVDSSGLKLTAPFSAPSAGPPPWSVYRIEIEAATALQTVAPGGATRWSFTAP